MKTTELIELIEELKAVNEAQAGVIAYALELLYRYGEDREDIEVNSECRKYLLNGAENWLQYSEGGCSLIYDEEIEERLSAFDKIDRKRLIRGLGRAVRRRDRVDKSSGPGLILCGILNK